MYSNQNLTKQILWERGFNTLQSTRRTCCYVVTTKGGPTSLGNLQLTVYKSISNSSVQKILVTILGPEKIEVILCKLFRF